MIEVNVKVTGLDGLTKAIEALAESIKTVEVAPAVMVDGVPVGETPTEEAPLVEAPAPAPVAPEYTIDTLTEMAVAKLNTSPANMKALQTFLASIGVDAIPQIQPEQYAAFAQFIEEL